MVEINLNDLYQQVFGTNRGKADFTNDLAEPSGIDPNNVLYDRFSFDVNADASSEFLNVRNVLGAVDFLGEPIFMPVKIGSFLLPNEPTITITTAKTIVETTLVGSVRRGSIKELISDGDYQINIRGFVINDGDSYPEDAINALHQLYLEKTSQPILCGLTKLLGISRVVFKDFGLPSMDGVQHAQAYDINLVSDEDFILEIDERRYNVLSLQG